MIREKYGKNTGTKIKPFVNQGLKSIDKNHKNMSLFSLVFAFISAIYAMPKAVFYHLKTQGSGLYKSMTYVLIREQTGGEIEPALKLTEQQPARRSNALCFGTLLNLAASTQMLPNMLPKVVL